KGCKEFLKHLEKHSKQSFLWWKTLSTRVRQEQRFNHCWYFYTPQQELVDYCLDHLSWLLLPTVVEIKVKVRDNFSSVSTASLHDILDDCGTQNGLPTPRDSMEPEEGC